jgi:uncharacterized protein with PQ loop repeat
MDDLETVDIIGYGAMLCATMIYMPQLLKIWNTQDAKSISYGLISLELSTDILWNIYAQMKGLTPLMLSSWVLFVSCLAMLGLKLKFEGKLDCCGRKNGTDGTDGVDIERQDSVISEHDIEMAVG